MLGAVVTHLELIGLARLQYAKRQLHRGKLARLGHSLLKDHRLTGGRVIDYFVIGAVVRISLTGVRDNLKLSTG